MSVDVDVDVVVIGAGANELVAAQVLARAGRRVVVLDGGYAHDEPETGWVAPQVLSAAGVAPSAVKTHCPDPWASAPLAGGGQLDLWRDMTRSVEAIRRVSERDAARWPAFCERMARLARLLETLYLEPPPDPLSRELRDLARYAGLGLRLHRLGRGGMEDLLRIIPMPVADLLDDWFENDTLKGILGAAGIMNLCQGPRSGGTAFRFLHRHVGSPPGVFRQPASDLQAVLAALPGIEIRREAEVVRITVREGRATGVALASGEEMAAARVVSGVEPARTLLALADPAWLDPELVRAVHNIRRRGVVARVTLALERTPAWFTTGSPWVVAPSLDYLERAYDVVKYRNVSRAPYLEARSDGRVSEGRCRAEVHFQYAPYALADGVSDDIERALLGRLALETFSRHASDTGAAAVESVLSPRDLEARFGFPEGQSEHAEPALDQMLWMRPLPELARYRTPIDGLYLCGAAMHPAGGVPGAAGYNAAREILRERR
jgi:phytoene dehydrogenase-like protein